MNSTQPVADLSGSRSAFHRGSAALRSACPALVALAAALVCLAGPLQAQKDDDLPWRDSFYPYITSASNDFPLLVFHFEERKPADYFAPAAFAGKLSLDVGASAKGSRFALVSFRAPLLWPKWRLFAQLGATRDARFGFYGLGNSAASIDSNVTKTNPFYYRARRTRYFGQVQVTRQLQSHFRVALGSGIERSRFSALPGFSVFDSTEGPRVEDTDLIGGAALIYDSRDNEYNTHQGLFLEADASGGTGGGGYGRFSGIARGYLQLREGTVAAVRLLGSGTTGSPPLNAKFEVPAWEGVVQVLGGPLSHRGLDYERFAGSGVLLGNIEVRQDLLNLGDYGGLTLLAFADAGRVFEGEPFKLTTKDMKYGGGGGIALRILRSTIFTFNFGGGPEGFVFSVGGGWMF